MVSQDGLGLFDTPPERRDVRSATAVVALLSVALLVVLPFTNVRVGEVAAFVPVADSIMFVGDLIVATLLYAQASLFRSRALTILATGYVAMALLLAAHALSFPGAFSPDGLLGGGVSTTGWLAAFRRFLFPIFVILYVLLSARDQTDQDRPIGTGTAVAIAFALAAAATILATAGQDLLPPLFVNRTDAQLQNLSAVALVGILTILAAIVLLLRQRKSILDLWLLVALAAWLIQSVLNLLLEARFTIGWYALYAIMVSSHLVVLVALIGEANRLYARLALATAARRRDRESQRLSMDAVAAAISHEVGQPLAAVSLNASAAERYLTAPRPNVAKAIESLREINASASHSFDVLKSIRAMFSKRPGWARELNINEVVEAAASRLATELAAARVSVQMSLDDSLPPVMANRVQMQHVVGNLIANAIESLGKTRGRRRRLEIRSSARDQSVILEISDNGIEMRADDPWRVFDALSASDTNGDGIRLSICRTIVEEHGGSISASTGDEHGTTFHVKLPAQPSRGPQSVRSGADAISNAPQ
jgi:signal transduction histidine kinase